MAKETQDFIDEIETPSFYRHSQRLTMLKALSRALGADGQQVAKLRGLLQDAEMAEADDSLRGRFEMLSQALGAMQRQQGKIAEEARRLHSTSRAIADQWVEFKAAAADVGYTIERGKPDA